MATIHPEAGLAGPRPTGGRGGSGAGGSGSGGSGSGGSGSGGSGFRRQRDRRSAGTGGTSGSGGSTGNDGSTADATDAPSDMSGGTEGGQADGAAGGMSFFVTSTGSGAAGGNLGGLVGADAKCEMLAAAVGAGGKGWKAYLSSSEAAGGMPAVNAKDGVGAGPWRNQAGQMVAANVTALLAGFAANLVRDEKGGTVPGNQHDILSGSMTDGTVYAGRTCGSWASTMGQSQVGHSDGANGGRLSAHASGCTQAGIQDTAGAGRTYCFATMP